MIPLILNLLGLSMRQLLPYPPQQNGMEKRKNSCFNRDDKFYVVKFKSKDIGVRHCFLLSYIKIEFLLKGTR